MQDNGLYADFPEAKDWIFGVDSIPLYHDAMLDAVSLTRILARMDLAPPPSNASLLAAALRVPEGARLTMLASSSAMPQAKTAVADMRRVCRKLVCTFSADDKSSHLVVVFVTQDALDELSDLVASLRSQGRRVIALCQVDERKGYDGVQRHVLSADERWQGVEPLRWVVYNDFRVASLTHILEALAHEAHRVGIFHASPPQHEYGDIDVDDGKSFEDASTRLEYEETEKHAAAALAAAEARAVAAEAAAAEATARAMAAEASARFEHFEAEKRIEDAETAMAAAAEARITLMQESLKRKERTLRILETQLARGTRMLASRSEWNDPNYNHNHPSMVGEQHMYLPRLNTSRYGRR
ncbi:serine/threonine-protein kinase Kist [Pycnococcus provasolii]